ncbi:hypothetical protein [Wenzhouxiangella limi]|uniref:DUF2845 domain-containing protein n=1 Tax=Wenzhouxiangella limi TaxID=2707351 RepID=A0A845US75_9GAMM|nr:hypothetical protein [Wenzhouxiangella limi]NDY94417.1 hypothetical protein [Wenzhouxiangella limi]
MIRRLTVLGLLALALSSAGAALADRQTDGDMLLIEKVMERMNRDLPGNGLSMAEVEQRFGSPTERAPAVGEPPITRWTYDGYSVYFEHDLVIESVLHPEVVMREVSDRQN